MTYSGAGNITGAITTVHTTGAASAATTSGCETSDFIGFTPGSIALLQRGSCSFAVKAAHAEAAGAGAVVIFNTGVGGNTGPMAGTLVAPQRTPSPRTGRPTKSSPRRPRAVPTTW